MRRKLKVNVVAAAAAAVQRTTNFFQTSVNFWFYSTILYDSHLKKRKPTVRTLGFKVRFLVIGPI